MEQKGRSSAGAGKSIRSTGKNCNNDRRCTDSVEQQRKVTEQEKLRRTNTECNNPQQERVGVKKERKNIK